MSARWILDDRPLELEDLALVLSEDPPQLELAPETREALGTSRAVIEEVLAAGRTVYGVNTGFGRLAHVRIADDQLQQLQRNLILSHATGVGEPLSIGVSRLMLLLRIKALCRGCSGVRVALVERLIDLFNRNWIPVIPQQGSVGASGDLAPLAHMALCLLGMGEVWKDGVRRPTAEVYQEEGVEPFVLQAKEGLGLINGTQCMTAIGVMAWLEAERLADTADIACAMSLEALRGSIQPFRAEVHDARGQLGQQETARHLRRLLEGSEILPSHADCHKVQDAYSLRCVPQVHGAVRDCLRFVRGVLEAEINAATDNPLVFASGEVISAGNFHGQPVGQAMDFLGISLSTLGNISERRIEQMVNPALSGLPAFLAPEPGIQSGLMIPQVVAASLASENKVLAHPSSVDTIPTSANQEDHVSMGTTAARHARDIARNTARILGIELICGAQGLEFDRSLRAGKGVEAAYACLRERVPPLEGDRFLAPDLEEAFQLVLQGKIQDAAARALQT
ncbi:MAG TPA: histidine ammonia-lyase [Planctomycetes bacterium]|nr:histidine ammonia-lyase [Planctomycetota bacterium]